MGVTRINKMVTVAMLAAVSFVLLFVGFPVLPGFSFLKIDFANVPILIGTVLFGPIWGVVTAGLAGLLDIIFKDSSPVGVLGIVANWLAAAAYVLPIYYIAKQNVTKATNQMQQLLKGIGLGTVLMTVVMAIANLFVMLPLYMKMASFQINVSTWNMVLYGIIPFNLIKGVVVGIVIAIIYFRLVPVLQRRNS